MAESVDALVSNTSGATHPGSSPGLGTRAEKAEVAEEYLQRPFFVYCQACLLHSGPEVFDDMVQSLVELDLRFPAQLLLGECNVGTTHLRVVAG